MSATLGMKNTTVRMFGNNASVPNNAIAKSMYYLNCVAAVIQYEDSALTDFQNYHELSGEELVIVYNLAKLLNPSLFLQYGIFILNPNLVFDAYNQFYEITDETIGVHVNQEISIGGRLVKVLKLMACNRNWLSSFYFQPIAEIESFIRRYKNRTTYTTCPPPKPNPLPPPKF